GMAPTLGTCTDGSVIGRTAGATTGGAGATCGTTGGATTGGGTCGTTGAGAGATVTPTGAATPPALPARAAAPCRAADAASTRPAVKMCSARRDMRLSSVDPT